MIIEIDLGNTRLKWRTLGSSRRGSLSLAEIDQLSLEKPEAVSRVRVASVGDEHAETVITNWSGAYLGVVPEFARSLPQWGGLKNSYAEPSRMGVDRWLAMLAARAKYPGNLLIFDAGTALTIEVLRQDGSHLGGYILPGKGMMIKALFSDTRRVQFEPQDLLDSMLPGRSTAEAVQHGQNLLLAGVVQQALLQAETQLGHFSIIVTGGDADALLRVPGLAGREVRHEPDLVLDGLAVALP